jgi:ABC-type proline/glycine betaine transport system permease subunit
MNIMPTSREGRWRLALLPFKAYIIAVPVVALLSLLISELAGWNSGYEEHSILAREQAHRYAILECGYVACILGLLIGASCQREKRARRSALLFTILAVVLLVLLYPAAQYVKTKHL